MNDTNDWVDELLQELKIQRDELRIRAHLAKMDASDELTELEEKLDQLESKARAVGGAAADSGADIGTALQLLGHEIKQGFKNIAHKL
jgi:ribosomal protein L12E/L44/L45/RPP1/RPP2